MRAVSLLALVATLSAPATAQDIAAPVQEAVARADLEEKVDQLQSTAPASPSMNLPAYDWWNEGLHGLARNGISTVFPQAVGLAATFDPALMEQVGTVVSTEVRAKFNAKGVDADRRIYEGLTIWSPNINIFRDPRWGRGQETYGEDPLLSGTLAVGFIRGLQGPDPQHPRTIATPKHLAVHSGPEAGRDSFDVDVSPQDLEATYLPAFRQAVTEAQPRSLMCAYNSTHGVPVCADGELLNDRLRDDWGFKGFVVSDCDAIANVWMFHHYTYDAAEASAASVKAGTDFDCGTTYDALTDSVQRGLITEGEVDLALARSLQARYDLGIAFGAANPWASIATTEVNTPGHRALALEAARKSIVLLQNSNERLPLPPGTKLAVIGANADDLAVLEGNYHGTAADPVTPLAGIRQRFGAGNVTYAQGSVLAEGAPVVVPETALSSNGQPGLAARLTSLDGAPIAARQDRRVDFNLTRIAPDGFRGLWTGTMAPPAPGTYRLVLDVIPCWKDCTRHDEVRLWLGDRQLHAGELGKQRVEFEVELDGTPQPIRLELDHYGEDEGLRLMWLPPADAQLAEAVAATQDADAIVAVLGLSPDLEGEALQVQAPGFVGGDRSDIALPEPQADLLAALHVTGKPVIVVLASGSAVALDADKADAVLAAWYPGGDGGTAIADILSGEVNPSGRLPVTFYRTTSDLPAFVDYSMKERTYRYFTGKPLWGFGHGLSYTSFAYDNLQLTAGAIGEPVTATVQLSNTGDRAGEEVVQAYVVPPDTGVRPILTEAVLQRQLGAFTRQSLAAGDDARITLTLDPRSLSTVDRRGTRRVRPGTYRVWVGSGQPGDGAGQWGTFTLAGEALELPK